MIRVGTANTTSWQRYLREKVKALSGPLKLYIEPDPDGRDDGESNSAVLSLLMRPSRSALAQRGRDLALAVDQGMRSRRWDASRMTLTSVAVVVGPFLARALAARLRSGRYVFNTEATRRRKHGLPPGVQSGQLADSLDNALVRVE